LVYFDAKLGGFRCVGVGIPQHIIRVLFFFYRLQRHISLNGMSMYVVPTQNLRLKMSRHTKKVEFVYEVVERNVAEPNHSGDDGTPDSSRHFLLGHAMRKRSRQNDGESFKQRPAFSMRLAFTGAFFKEDGVAKQGLFCSAIITPLRNFDMLSYITGSFLVQPKMPKKEIYNDWNELLFCWKQILQYEAATNCGLNGDPCENMIEPGGELGVFTLTSLLTVPLRIADVIRRNHVNVSDIQILGTPKLSYSNDEDMDQYMRYTDEYINEASRCHEQLMTDIGAFNKADEKEKATMEFLVASPGGWPLKSVPIEGDHRRVFVRFGNIFPFPIVMDFRIFRFMSEIVSMDSFQMNIGVLPKSVLKKARDFLTCEPAIDEEANDDDDDFEIPDEDDDHILTEKGVATPLVISERFYSKTSVIGQDLKTNGMMLSWYHAMTHKMQEDRRAGRITPRGGMDVVMGHLRQCLENHKGVMAFGGYRSFHLEQGMEMVENVMNTPLKEVLLADYVNHLRRTKVDQRIRHDPYLSMCAVFFLAYCDINREFVLSAPNLECLMEVQFSALHYLLGSHSAFVSFFQGVMIMNARGHLNTQDPKEGLMMDWRKPNSSGAGFIQERLNEFAKLLGVKFGIMPAANKMIMGTMNRMTDGALEGSVCVQIIQGEVVGNPPKEINDQPMMMTEARFASYTSWIRFGFKRDSTEDTFTISTVDLNKTNMRDAKIMVRFFCVALLCLPADRRTPPPTAPSRQLADLPLRDECEARRGGAADHFSGDSCRCPWRTGVQEGQKGGEEEAPRCALRGQQGAREEPRRGAKAEVPAESAWLFEDFRRDHGGAAASVWDVSLSRQQRFFGAHGLDVHARGRARAMPVQRARKGEHRADQGAYFFNQSLPFC
jgi:hypothetical protein